MISEERKQQLRNQATNQTENEDTAWRAEVKASHDTFKKQAAQMAQKYMERIAEMTPRERSKAEAHEKKRRDAMKNDTSWDDSLQENWKKYGALPQDVEEEHFLLQEVLRLKDLRIDKMKSDDATGKRMKAAVRDFVSRMPAQYLNEAQPLVVPDKLTMTEVALFKIAIECPKLDESSRKTPGHWNVFLAAWKDRLSGYKMERQRKWKRSTVRNRLAMIEKTLLHGEKIERFAYDSGILTNVEKQLAAGREQGATIHRKSLLDNTTETNEDRDG